MCMYTNTQLPIHYIHVTFIHPLVYPRGSLDVEEDDLVWGGGGQ